MTEHDLSTMLREHVRAGEPPLTITAGTAVLDGRRILRRRRARRGAVTVVAAAAAVGILVPVLRSPGAGDHARHVDPATVTALAHYDATKMPAMIDAAVQASFEDVPGKQTFVATDSSVEQALPRQYWGKASSMTATYGGQGDHQYRVYLAHAKSEAEGSATKYCSSGLSAGYYLSCTVTRSDAGDTVITDVAAVRWSSGKDDPFMPRGWSALTREDLAGGPTDQDRVFFVRSVKVVHSETFLSVAQEYVKATTLDQANDRWKTSAAALTDVATDPTLVMPKPPMGPNGCVWMLHPENVTCSKAK